MENNEFENTTQKFEKALDEAKKAKYVLRLFIAGNTTRSAQAIENIQEICEKQLKGRYTLEVVDIYQQPELARGEQIIAAPTLIKTLPLPLRRIIGDLSSTERILVGLNLQPVDGQSEIHHRTGKEQDKRPESGDGDGKG
ncbi:MAG: thiol-disulfide isomerase [Chloroflexi bacterium]|nr:MAG: thiol-disulfide isomerase [Chloroflexota bacterium]